jgi:hypothetical protein
LGIAHGHAPGACADIQKFIGIFCKLGFRRIAKKQEQQGREGAVFFGSAYD